MCGKELKNPNSTSYVNSKFHQDKLQQSSLGKFLTKGPFNLITLILVISLLFISNGPRFPFARYNPSNFPCTLYNNFYSNQLLYKHVLYKDISHNHHTYKQ